jgi:predicted ATPase
MIEKSNFFIFTGGPGVGKTTLLRHLETLGERVVEETARAVIREQVESGGQGLPWADARLYCDICAARDIASFDALANETGRVFFDRGLTDAWRSEGVDPSPALVEAVRTRRYNRRVFVFPPWREIYETDAERKQDWAEAEATFPRIISGFEEMGYEAIVVPQASVADRAAFVLEHAVF